MIKFDLGVETLTILDKTLKSLAKNNVNVDLDNINLNDSLLLKILVWDTLGVFQLESYHEEYIKGTKT